MNDEEDIIDPPVKKKFFDDVRQFYVAIASTILKKFSFSDHVLDDLSVLMPEHQTNISVAAVLRLAEHFPSAVPENAVDQLEEEVLDYTLMSPETLPTVHKETGKLTKSEELCTYWQSVGKLMTMDGNARFPNLTSLAKCLLALPHSNADTERVFSIVRKIMTDYRTEMEQSTLCALLACKLNVTHHASSFIQLQNC